METILTEVNGAVGTITLNRPKALNALNIQMMKEVRETLDKWESDPSIRCIVFLGGEKAFAAGVDITEMTELQAADAIREDFAGTWTQVANCTKPTIAAVAGYALGGGCELAMMCDIMLAADTAQFGQPEIKIGTIPGLGGTQRLTNAIGKSKAMEMCLTGRRMKAEEAERAGLVARVVPAAELTAEAQKLAATIAEMPSNATQLTRAAIKTSLNTGLEQGLDYERKVFLSLFGSPEQKEGMSAFVEKREPKFH